MWKRRLIIFAMMLVAFATAVIFMPRSLDDPSAYPELNAARPFPWEVKVLFPGELCDSLDKTFHDRVKQFLVTPNAERPIMYDQVLEARAELTKYGCTVP